ncbi:hypothetical protein [Haloarcula nitratireducens]|uniref:Uncharacterized protein n=1 Tax=Haloarcula nitratireducens TaxID=2487749 RepID=A0AAW4PJZ3_9EURY|nr:hypothetical protein [Halomicroarcula nitratireducens]MBX0298291.1 hypothetical protein [Halomicroarcula nitratireducens]
MSGATNDSARTASLVQTLCEAEGHEVVFRFDGPMSVPTSKYDGSSYRSDTLPKATLNATIWHASVEGAGETLMCFAKISMEELDRVGIDPSIVYTESGEGSPEYCAVDVNSSRRWWLDEFSDLTMEEAEQAIEEDREEDVLPPWDGLPTVTVNVERTDECQRKSYNSGFHIQYDPPTHEIGNLIDVRIK